MRKRIMSCLLIVAMLMAFIPASVTAADIHINTLEGSSQMILAEVSDASSSYATVSAYEKTAAGTWELIKQTLYGRVGSKGVSPVEVRQQDTRTTPEGILKLKAAYGQTADPGTLFPYTQITEDMYWDLNDGSETYNRLVCSDPGGDREQLIKYNTYKYMFTTDYNEEQIAGKGGAIFLHCNGAGATSGCVSVPEDFMKWCMTWLDPAKAPSLVVTTTADKSKYLSPAASTVTVAYSSSGNTVSWTLNDSTAEYAIQKSASASGPYTTVHTSTGAAVVWSDTDGNRNDYYRVITSNIIGGSGYSTVSESSVPPIPFSDVQDGKYYTDPVLWGAENHYVNGMTSTTFEPNRECTRAQVITFLYRMAGEPEISGENPFTDVTEGTWYYKAVLWGAETGIVQGITDTTFCPDLTCTRAQVVTFLWRYMGSPAGIDEAQNPFSDISAESWYYNAVLWGNANQIVYGMAEDTFSPFGSCTRGQVVTFMYRLAHQ